MDVLQHTQFYGLSILETLAILTANAPQTERVCTSVVCLGATTAHVPHCGVVFCLRCGQASEVVHAEKA